MTWVGPEFTCGECGGTIARWPMVNLLRQEILDWRHKTVPAGVTEHRAVLGTPAHRPRIIDTPKKAPAVIALTAEEDAAEVEEAVVEQRLVGRPATYDDLPTSARRLDAKAAEHGWESQAYIMEGDRVPGVPVEVVVLFLGRDGHILTTSWSTKRDGTWVANESYSFGHRTRQVSSRELGRLVEQPRALCESCGQPPALHDWTSDDPVCQTYLTDPKEESS